jgi:hypothetical protein
MTGYLDGRYARSLAEFGTPRLLRRTRGWLLEREIPGTACRDAMSCYPIFVCHDWRQLHVDLGDLAGTLVSVSVVTDPFGDYDLDYLRYCFSDVLLPFKKHYVIDLNLPLDAFVSRHHRLYARKALRTLDVQQCREPSNYLDEWVDLYVGLTRRHGMTGIRAFSRRSFRMQLEVPGVVMFRACEKGRTVAMSLWYTHGKAAYYHLAAANEEGYRSGASYALVWAAIEHFGGGRIEGLDLGAGAGLTADISDGLSWFKDGWSSGTRLAYFGGRIIDPELYEALTGSPGPSSEGYFPAYRAGEFG